MTDKLAGIKFGDRVRVTFEGEVVSPHNRVSVLEIREDGGVHHDTSWFSQQHIDSPTFKIERIEAPIKVGDTVFDAAAGSRAEVVGEVVTRGNRYLWLDGGASGFRTRHESAVIRA